MKPILSIPINGRWVGIPALTPDTSEFASKTYVNDTFATKEALDDDIAEVINRIGHVTPEIFGAVGDGETDDTAAFEDMFQALNGTHSAVLLTKSYVISNRLDINDVELYGANGATVTQVDNIGRTEFCVYVSGTVIIEGIKFVNCYGKLFKFTDTEDVRIRNCEFITEASSLAPDIEFGQIDFYTNNHGAVIEGNVFYTDMPTHAGGIWIREFHSDRITSNIIFRNNDVYHASLDECLAIWDWNGQVIDTFVEGCSFISLTQCADPHFLRLEGNSTTFSNCKVVINHDTATSVFLSHLITETPTKVIGVDVIINGESDHSVRINQGCGLDFISCSITAHEHIELAVFSPDTGANAPKFYNCKISAARTFSIGNRCTMHGCSIDFGTTKTNWLIRGDYAIHLYNCMCLNGNADNLIQFLADSVGKLAIINCTFENMTVTRFILSDNKNTSFGLVNVAANVANMYAVRGATGEIFNCIFGGAKGSIASEVIMRNTYFDGELAE